MLLNRDSRGWVIVCLAIFVAATVAYFPYVHSRPEGPSGGSVVGLVYAGVGSAMMLFALLLGARKRFRTLRIGRAYLWLQGHVWFGLLAYPIIIYHSGFNWGGTFTQVLMWLFTIVVVSGIFGILLQQLMPSRLLRDVQYETIYEQIDHVIEQLRTEADRLVEEVVQRSGGEAFEMEVMPAGVQTATLPEASLRASQVLSEVYQREIKPFLQPNIPPHTRLLTTREAGIAFDQIGATLPAAYRPTLVELARIVEERRQLGQQKRFHHLLHGWLLVHVPLSYALILLAAWHAVIALRYVHVR